MIYKDWCREVEHSEIFTNNFVNAQNNHFKNGIRTKMPQDLNLKRKK